MALTVAQITAQLRTADAAAFAVLEKSLAADGRKGVRAAVEAARKRLQAEALEQTRIDSLYDYQNELAISHGGSVVLGLDEVGRGPIAGPLVVGGVVLVDQPRIAGLNDSKQLKPERREELSLEIKEHAIAWTVQYVAPEVIDSIGIAASLRKAFTAAIRAIESQGVKVDVVLLDGNPMHLDPREVNVVKGDAKCASVAAASIVAKVDRDAYMCGLAEQYPEYGFEGNKGYGSQSHIEAIKQHGLSPVHRATFCKSFDQPTLF